jgi:hypothetical protein
MLSENQNFVTFDFFAVSFTANQVEVLISRIFPIEVCIS